MIQWPTKLIQFMERPVPKFSHIAAMTHGMPPVNCRGYGFHIDIENGLAVVYLLRSQWLKLNEYLRKQKWLAVLVTAGTDNESYQSP
ncbi:hypothetical protein [Paenibacillus sedimenti]|uniref:Uncharacterized protein n=1 Tax=Paenibacillus sedimenti TaxID=2770274 RepID=A0A926QHZ3_9BACL|nr:hypothetical protein [Paenibacillus sedimenti]MBD0380051.1 hypothetical protein [Paenibacillus sedimenti]